MAEMTDRHFECFKHFIQQYAVQYKLNAYSRDAYDSDMEYYLGYRDSTRYPLAYSMVFNKLLPRVQNVLSRYMEQLYQGGPNGFVSVRPRKSADVDRAPRVESVLNYQLETLNNIDQLGGGYLFNFMWMFNALTWGSGIAKVYWRKEERITPRRMSIPIPTFDNYGNISGVEMSDITVEMPQVVYDQPYAEIIHNKCFVPHPHYKSIQQMPAVFCVYKKSIEYIKQMVDKGVFIKKYLANLGWSGEKAHSIARSYQSTGMDSAQSFSKSLELEGIYFDSEYVSDLKSPEIDIIEGYGRYIFPEDETPYEVGSGIKIKGRESEAIVHIGNYRTLLSIQKNKYGIRPFFNISGYYHPELFWDIGLIRLGKDIQEQYNTLGNTRFQNAIMMVNQMLKVREDADIDPAALVWKPYGLVPVSEMTDIEPLITPDVSQSGAFREQEQFFEETLSEMTGETPYNLGQVPQRQEYVGTMYSLQAVGQSRARLLLMTMDYQGFQPMLKHYMRLNTFHLPMGFEARISEGDMDRFVPLFSGDIHFDYDFSARYTAMEPALGKHFRVQNLIQLAQLWFSNPQAMAYINQFQWMKAIHELITDRHDVDKFYKRPEQVQAEQMQNAQQAAQMELMGAHLQNQLAEAQSGRELQRDMIKGLLK